MRLFVVVRLCVFFWLSCVSLGMTTKAYAQTSQERVAVLDFKNKAGEAKHLAKVKREWAKLTPILKAKGKPAEHAIKLFLKRYNNHPQGNPLADTALAALEANVRGDDASAVSVGSGKAGIRWIKIPAGHFNLGSNDGHNDEKPEHRVQVKAFLMSETEVTVGQYRKCVEAGRCSEPNIGRKCTWGGSDDHPINCVDWGQARTFAVWVGGDLPTEAQWEYAARGGQLYKYAGSNNVDEIAWYDRNASSTKAVKSKKANGYGLYDMSGNVCEWTLDKYHSAYNGAPSQAENPWGDVGECRQDCDTGSSRHVIRGGSWNRIAWNLRVAGRSNRKSVNRRDFLGFRVRRTLP